MRMTQQAIEWKVIGVALGNDKRAEWAREQMRVKGVLVEIKKKWTWPRHVMWRQDNGWSLRVTVDP